MITNKSHLQINHHRQWYSDNDEDCSCSSCECSNCADEVNSKAMCFKPVESNNPPTTSLVNKSYYPVSAMSYFHTSLNHFDKHGRFSINCNQPSINLPNTEDTSSKIKRSLTPPDEFLLTEKLNEQILEHHSTTSQQEKSSAKDLEYINELIDQAYTKIPVLYNSIKQTKLDTDFLISVNDYLDRLKANIYKDLIRRETLLRNGKNHTHNILSLLRCISKISYEQSVELSNDSRTIQHAVLYTMTAIDYILQRHLPTKKPLFNYILNEYISMWLHENLRVIQEDFSILAEHGTKENFSSLRTCLLQKFKSLCAINWERLQMLQNYRLTHFNQLMKSTSMKLETNKDFVILFGKPWKLTMKRSDIPVTLLYSNRTDNELININEVHDIFKKSIARILRMDNQKFLLSPKQSYSPERITPSIEITSSISTKLFSTDLHSKSQELSQPSIPDEDQLIKDKDDELDENKAMFTMSNHEEKSLSVDILKESPRPLTPESQLISIEHQQLFSLIEPASSEQEVSPALLYQSSFQSINSLSPSQTSIKTKYMTSPSVENIQPIYASPLINPLKSEHLNDRKQISNEENSLDFASHEPSFINPTLSEKLFPREHVLPTSDRMPSDKTTAILNTEVNRLIHFLTKLASSSSLRQHETEPVSLLKQLECCLQEAHIVSDSIIYKIQQTHSQSSLNVQDPLFLAEFTRVLRQELEDAHVLRQVDRGQLDEDSQNIGHLLFETRNILKLSQTSAKNHDATGNDNIDQDRVFIEVTHDPSRCLPHPEFSCRQHHPSNHHGSLDVLQTKLPTNQSMESNRSQPPMYWIRSKQYSTSQDCVITPSSLFCARKLSEKNTHSITVEHNEEFR